MPADIASLGAIRGDNHNGEFFSSPALPSVAARVIIFASLLGGIVSVVDFHPRIGFEFAGILRPLAIIGEIRLIAPFLLIHAATFSI